MPVSSPCSGTEPSASRRRRWLSSSGGRSRPPRPRLRALICCGRNRRSRSCTHSSATRSTRAFPAQERETEHARAAEILAELEAPPEQVAAQLLLAPPESVPGAVTSLREAAGRASAEAGLESAARYLARALEEPLERRGAGRAAARAGRRRSESRCADDHRPPSRRGLPLARPRPTGRGVPGARACVVLVGRRGAGG